MHILINNNKNELKKKKLTPLRKFPCSNKDKHF